MPRREMTLEMGVRRILNEHYKSSKSVKDSTDRLYQVVEVLGADTHLNSIDERDISKLKQAFKERNNSNATVNRKLAALSKLLSMAFEEWLVIDRKPAMKKLKEDKAQVHLLSREDEELVIDHLVGCGEYLMKSLVVCLLYSGCRLSEMLRLQDKDIDWRARRLKVRDTKNGEPVRVIPMTNKVERELKELVVEQGKQSPFGGLTRSWCSYRWNNLRDKLGFPSHEGFKIHCLRHTCATRLLKADVQIQIVKEWLGHSSIEMTMKYYRFVHDDLDEARDKLQDF